MKRNFNKSILGYAFLSILILLIFSGSYVRLLDNNELDTLDFRFRVRPQIGFTDKVALIDIGADSIERLGRFPFERSYHAILVKALSQAGAKAVLFDIFFSEPSGKDLELEKAIKSAGNVYLPYVLDIAPVEKKNIPRSTGYSAQTLENFTELAKGTGHINVIPDADGKFRRVPLLVRHEGSFSPFVSFLLSCDYLGISQKDVVLIPGRHLRLGDKLKIPLDERSNIIVNFSGKWGRTFQHFSYVDVLQSYIAGLSGEKPFLDLGQFKDKVCIIGLTAEGTTDLHPNPFESLFPATGIHAEIFNSILNNNFITRASPGINLIILLVLFLGIAGTALRTQPLKGFCLLLLVISLFVLSSVILFAVFGLWIDVFYPIVTMGLVYLLCTLFQYVMEWKKRLIMENELQIAKKIQESFLPKTTPTTGGCEIAGTMLTAKQVGGDLYDYLEFENDKLGIMIGDVTGKGVPASLFMAMVVGAFKFFAKEDTPPEESLQLLNQKLMKESSSKLFVTMYYAVFDTRNKIMRYGNGGHLPAIYAPKEGEPQFLDVEDGLPIGMIKGNYSGNQINYNKGDLFVFYTDGITEAAKKNGEMYGEKRLEALIKEIRDLPVDSIAKNIEQNVRKFAPHYRQQDDVTFIVVRV